MLGWICSSMQNSNNGEINLEIALPPQKVKVHKIKKNTIAKKKALIRASVDRLSKPKTYVSLDLKSDDMDSPTRGTQKTKSVREIIALTDRLSKIKPCSCSTHQGVTVCDNKYMNRSFKKVTEIDERLCKEIKRKDAPGIDRGPKKSLHDLDGFIERMATPKKYKDRDIVSRSVNVETRTVTPQNINKLCLKLANPDSPLTRTPETKRILDKRYSPVNTYAWQGLGYKVPEYLAIHVVQ